MGLKIGFAAEAASRKKVYIKLKTYGSAANRGMSFARVVLVNRNGEMKFFLRYLNGHVGELHLSRELQLEVGFIRFGKPKPRDLPYLNGKEIPKELIFCDDYTSDSVSDGDLLPPEEHASNEARFSSPSGLWNRTVAGLVSQ